MCNGARIVQGAAYFDLSEVRCEIVALAPSQSF